MGIGPYFQLRIERIPVGHVPNKGPDGYHDGCFPDGSQEELAKLAENDDQPWIVVDDNGVSGDGLYLALYRNEPKTDDPDDLGMLAGFTIPDSSLDLIIAALTAVREMRKAQTDNKKG